MTAFHDVAIIGSGPAGYTAALYLGRAGLNPVLFTGATTPGGQLVNTSLVENFPGFPEGIQGPDLMDAMRTQAERFGTTFVNADVTAVTPLETAADDSTSAASPHPSNATNNSSQDASDVTADISTSAPAGYTLTLADGSTHTARAVIVATGSAYRKLGVPGEQEYAGQGVSYCATCDGYFFKDQPIVVVGGGDAAFEEAIFLTRFSSTVTLIHRRDKYRASDVLIKRAQACDNLQFLTNATVTAIHGEEDDADEADSTNESSAPVPTLGQIHRGILPQLTLGGSSASGSTAGGHVTSVGIRNMRTGEEGTLKTSAVFIAIGSTPATNFLGSLVTKDDHGYIETDGASTRTSAPGIFASGDCADPTYRQAVSAAGMGCRAALDVQVYLAKN